MNQKETCINVAEHKVRFTVTEKGAQILNIFKEHSNVKPGDTLTMFFRELFYFFGVAFHSYKHELFVDNQIIALGEVLPRFTFYFKNGTKKVLDGIDQTAAWIDAGFSNDDLSSLAFVVPGVESFNGFRYEFGEEGWKRKLNVRQQCRNFSTEPPTAATGDALPKIQT
jgi:hypothetical protein